MALSVLTISHEHPKSHILYSSDTETAIMVGTEDAMYAMKHEIEDAEQQADNREHLKKLKEKYLSMITSSGKTIEEANEFLKKQMPFLYENT